VGRTFLSDQKPALTTIETMFIHHRQPTLI
jgi:hypothetical protein